MKNTWVVTRSFVLTACVLLLVIFLNDKSLGADVYVYKDKDRVLTFSNVPTHQGFRRVVREADIYVYRDKEGVLNFTSVPCTSEQLERGCARVERAREWEWNWDPNHDGKVTISDMPGWAKWMFSYPGDWVIYELLKHPGKAAEFLELTPASYGGAMSLVISVVLICFGFFAALVGLLLLAVLIEPLSRILFDIPLILLCELYFLLPANFRIRIEEPGRRGVTWWERYVPDTNLLYQWLLVGGFAVFLISMLVIVPSINILLGLDPNRFGLSQWLVFACSLTSGIYLCLRGYRWHLAWRERRTAHH
jgi:hypothetical protein